MSEQDNGLEELQEISPGAREYVETSVKYIHLPILKLPAGCVPSSVEALLCLAPRDGYTTRLFLSSPITGRGANWTTHRILDKTWHTWSWNNVPGTLRPTQILAEHLRALR